MRIALICTIGMVLGSCVLAQDAQETVYRGKVVDENGRPLAGATVNGYAAVYDVAAYRYALKEVSQTTTGDDGTFLLKDRNHLTLGLVATARKDGLACGWHECNTTVGDSSEAVIALGRPASISGAVVDEGGRPITGATVHTHLAYGLDSDSGPQHMFGLKPVDWLIVKTDADGRFQLDNLPADASADFFVEAPGRARIEPQFTGNDELQYSAGQHDVKLVMKPEGRIEGVLVRNDGKPVAGASLEACKTEPGDLGGRLMPRLAATDKDGKFTFEGLDAGEYGIRTLSDEGSRDFIAVVNRIAVEYGKTASSVKIEASEGVPFLVTVTDNDGKPIAGAIARLIPKTGEARFFASNSGATDANGVATVRVEPGIYRVRAEAKGYTFNPGLDTDAVAEQGKSAEARVALEPLMKVRGMVRDAEGKPVPGATVLLGGAYTQYRGGLSGQNGQFEIGSQPLPMGMPGSGEDAPRLLVRHAERGLAAEVKDQDLTKPVEVTVKPAMTLTGQVVGEDGRPIAKARLAVSAVGYWGPRVTVRGVEPDAVTDERGRYQLKGILPGGYNLAAWAKGFGRNDVTIAAEAGKDTIEVDTITLKPAKFSVSGVCRDADGKPVAGALVSINGEGQSRDGFVRTDKDGKFTVDRLVEGDVQIFASAPGKHGSAEATVGDSDVEIIVREPDRSGPGPAGRGSMPATRRSEDF